MAGDDVRGYGNKRMAQRNPIRCDVILHGPGGSVPAHVQNLSTRGAGIVSPNPPSVGDRVHLEFPALLGRPTVDAVVRHASRRARQLGVEFDHPCETTAKVTEELVKSHVNGDER
jgi:PilZ domain-containing protein